MSISLKTTTSSIRPSKYRSVEPFLSDAPIATAAFVIAILFEAVPLALRTTLPAVSSHTLNSHAFVVLLKVAPR